jgi:hypothetical protein
MGNTSSNVYAPAKTGSSRLFLIEGRARGDHSPLYSSQYKMTGLSRSFGAVTKIEVPDPDNYEQFIEVDRVRGAKERATTSLVGKFAAALKSKLLELADRSCAVDVQLHIGACTDPSSFNQFTKAIICEDVLVTTHTTDDLGAIGSDENAQVNETAEISMEKYYEVVPIAYASRAGDIVTNAILDIVIGDSATCGTCGWESNGCQAVFALTTAAGGSPSTPADVVFSFDGGRTWKAHDVDFLATAVVPSSLAVVGDYLVVISNADVSLGYCSVQDLRDGIDPTFTKVTTGLSALGKPNHIEPVGRKAFISGDFGFVYFVDDVVSGVVAVETGVSTISKLNYVHALDSYNAVAVGNDGAVIFTRDRYTWDKSPSTPVGIGTHLTSVWMKSTKEWWVTASSGYIWYTINSGKSWTRKSLPGTAPTSMKDIEFSTDSVGFAAGVVSNTGKIYRTFDGGNSWVITPESTGTIPTNQEITRIATCRYDANFVVGGGLATGGTDGFIVVGS